MKEKKRRNLKSIREKEYNDGYRSGFEIGIDEGRKRMAKEIRELIGVSNND